MSHTFVIFVLGKRTHQLTEILYYDDTNLR